MSKSIRSLVFLLAVLSLDGCTSIFAESENPAPLEKSVPKPLDTFAFAGSESGGDYGDNRKWLLSGSITLARVAPKRIDRFQVDNTSLALTSPDFLAFAPLPENFRTHVFGSPAGWWLSLEQQSGVASLLNGGTKVASYEVEGLDSLAPGIYKVQYKAEKPVWYAPDSYFAIRGLQIPPEGSSRRFLRGAFGQQAIYLSSTVALHCSPLWTEEVGGVRLPCDYLKKLSSVLAEGAAIEVR